MIEAIDAYILHSRPYRETSQILDVFTQSKGRVQLIAKGVKRKNTGLQLFQCYSIQFRGRNELKTLVHYESTDSRHPLVGKKLFCGFYINELLTRLLQLEDDCPRLFTHYQHCLLNLVENNEQAVLRQFEFQLLDYLGYSYDFYHDLNEQPIEATAEYAFQFIFEQGFMPCFQQTGSQQDIFSAAQLIALREQQFESASKAAKRFIRLALHPYLGDKPLQSRQLFQ